MPDIPCGRIEYCEHALAFTASAEHHRVCIVFAIYELEIRPVMKGRVVLSDPDKPLYLVKK